MNINARTIAAIGAAVLLPVTTYLRYTDLNIVDRSFVGWLGCGCQPFFNTNDLSFLVFAGVLTISAFLWWPVSRTLPSGWRIGFRVVASVVSVWFLWFCMAKNIWL